MILKGIYNILSNFSELTAFVGTKIYPIRTPQATALPYLITAVNTVEPSDTKDGFSRLDTYFFTVVVYADYFSSEGTNNIESIYNAVRRALDRKASGSYGGVLIQSIQYQSHNDSYDESSKVFIREILFKGRLIKAIT